MQSFGELVQDEVHRLKEEAESATARFEQGERLFEYEQKRIAAIIRKLKEHGIDYESSL